MQRVLCDCSIRVTVVLGVSQLSCKFLNLNRVWQIFISSVKTSEGQNDFHQPGHVYTYILPHPLYNAFCSYLAIEVSYPAIEYCICICLILLQYLKSMLWHLDTLLEKSVDWKINTSIWFCCMKKKSLMEDERNNEEQRHISLVSLLLWHKIAAAWCLIWHLGLWMWSSSEAVRWNFGF